MPDLDGVKTAALWDVARRFGLEKLGKGGWQALFREAPPARSQGLLRNAGRELKEFGREAIFGSPLTVADQLKKHYRATGSIPGAAGRYLKDFYAGKSTPTWMKAVSIGMPVLDATGALLGPKEERNAQLGGAVTSALAAPITSRLGLLGAPVYDASRRIGQALGSRLD